MMEKTGYTVLAASRKRHSGRMSACLPFLHAPQERAPTSGLVARHQNGHQGSLHFGVR